MIATTCCIDHTWRSIWDQCRHDCYVNSARTHLEVKSFFFLKCKAMLYESQWFVISPQNQGLKCTLGTLFRFFIHSPPFLPAVNNASVYHKPLRNGDQKIEAEFQPTLEWHRSNNAQQIRQKKITGDMLTARPSLGTQKENTGFLQLGKITPIHSSNIG